MALPHGHSFCIVAGRPNGDDLRVAACRSLPCWLRSFVREEEGMAQQPGHASDALMRKRRMGGHSGVAIGAHRTRRGRPARPRPTLRWAAGAVILICGFDATAIADSCDTLTGGVNCNTARRTQSAAPSRGESQAGQGGGWWLTQSRPFQGLGSDLSSAEPPATFGAITFGGDGRRCSGLFRTGSC